jgi:hypothetical protein
VPGGGDESVNGIARVHEGVVCRAALGGYSRRP